jgi:copper oxidase (laccase) domain-containing protein
LNVANEGGHAPKRSPVEQFPALDSIGNVRHAFIARIPGIDVSANKAQALKRLSAVHREFRNEIGIGVWPLLAAQQIHADQIAVVDYPIASDKEFAGCDGIIANQRRVALGIHVADCAAVYIVDPKTPAVGLVHSGKNGTQLGIVSKAIAQMTERFGSQPADLVVQLSPCIRPPHYEIDFAATIIDQCRSSGVQQVYDTALCTACDLDRFYSYRAEKGKTGRMFALLGLS